jgi:hypothetical protein
MWQLLAASPGVVDAATVVPGVADTTAMHAGHRVVPRAVAGLRSGPMLMHVQTLGALLARPLADHLYLHAPHTVPVRCLCPMLLARGVRSTANSRCAVVGRRAIQEQPLGQPASLAAPLAAMVGTAAIAARTAGDKDTNCFAGDCKLAPAMCGEQARRRRAAAGHSPALPA